MKKTKKQIDKLASPKASTYKLPASAKEEPKTLPSKYEEEPLKKGKTHYEEDEEEITEA